MISSDAIGKALEIDWNYAQKGLCTWFKVMEVFYAQRQVVLYDDYDNPALEETKFLLDIIKYHMEEARTRKEAKNALAKARGDA